MTLHPLFCAVTPCMVIYCFCLLIVQAEAITGSLIIDVMVSIVPCISSLYYVVRLQQLMLSRQIEMDKEVNMEARRDSLRGIRPFGDQNAFRVLFIEQLPDLLPECTDAAAVRVVLDERRGHVHAEAVRTQGKPELHDVDKLLLGCAAVRVVHRELPRRIVNLREAVIERRLAIEEVLHVHAVALTVTADAAAVVVFQPVVRPDIAVCILIFLRQSGFLKPLAFQRGMPRDQINDDLDAVFVCIRAERGEILIRAVTRRDLVKVCDIIARVAERRFIERIQPDCREAHVADVGQLRPDTIQITDAVRICVIKRLRIDVVKNRG